MLQGITICDLQTRPNVFGTCKAVSILLTLKFDIFSQLSAYSDTYYLSVNKRDISYSLFVSAEQNVCYKYFYTQRYIEIKISDDSSVTSFFS